MDNKELFIQHHENLIARYMDVYPDADWTDAYEATAQEAYNTFGDYLADLADFAD
jgi:hypothetical protein